MSESFKILIFFLCCLVIQNKSYLHVYFYFSISKLEDTIRRRSKTPSSRYRRFTMPNPHAKHLNKYLELFAINDAQLMKIRRYIREKIRPKLLDIGHLQGPKYEKFLLDYVFPRLKGRFCEIFTGNYFENPRTEQAMAIRRLLFLEKQYYRRKEGLTK